MRKLVLLLLFIPLFASSQIRYYSQHHLSCTRIDTEDVNPCTKIKQDVVITISPEIGIITITTAIGSSEYFITGHNYPADMSEIRYYVEHRNTNQHFMFTFADDGSYARLVSVEDPYNKLCFEFETEYKIIH